VALGIIQFNPTKQVCKVKFATCIDYNLVISLVDMESTKIINVLYLGMEGAYEVYDLEQLFSNNFIHSMLIL